MLQQNFVITNGFQLFGNSSSLCKIEQPFRKKIIYQRDVGIMPKLIKDI
jgi:hypothetical protein